MGSISIHSSSSVEDAMPMETLHNRTNRQSNLNGLAGRGAELEERRVSAHGGRPNATSNLEKWLFGKNCLDRKLKRHHITSIAFSGTIGIGLFVTSGELIGISGSGGCVIAFIGAGFIIIPVMRSLAELVSVRPVSGALMDYPHIFVDEALGFAVGVVYLLSQCASMATLTAAAARAADDFRAPEGLSSGQKAGIIVGLWVVTLLSNICGVQLYGNLERGVKWFKLALIIGLCILMILVAAGLNRIENRPTNNEQYQNYAPSNSFAPYFRWVGFNNTQIASELAEGGTTTGIAGPWGTFLAIWNSTILAMFACMGGDIVIVTAGEARTPRRDLPAAARFMYLVPIGLYILASFLAGLNVNFGDPQLYHPYAAAEYNQAGYHSPFLIALKYTSMPKALSTFFNACFLFSAYTAANTGLYSASRTLFALTQTYGNSWAKKYIGTTGTGGTPKVAIFICAAFGFLALIGIGDAKNADFNQAILTLSSFFTGSVSCVYASECLSYLRFKKCMTERYRKRLYNRDDDDYKTRYYRAHWQPACAIIGLVGCLLAMVFSGWPAIYLLREGGSVKPEGGLKSAKNLGADIAGAYIGPLLFIALYLGYKLIYRTTIRRTSDFNDQIFIAEFDNADHDPPLRQGPMWKRVLRDIADVVK